MNTDNSKAVTLTAEESKAFEAIFTFADNAKAKLAALVAVIFTQAVMADEKAYKAARGKAQFWLIQQRGLAVESARVEVYRLLAFVGLQSPGKNSGANNGKQAEASAKVAEAEAIVAQGDKAVIAALTACVTSRPRNISKARKILDALQAADKAASEAVAPEAE